MNTTKIHRFIPRLFSAVLFLSSSFPILGQEIIREAATEVLNDTSIIREVAKDTIMIYSCSEDTNTGENIASFILMVNGAYYPYKISVDSIYVKDFEVYRSTIFFCGYMYVNKIKKAMFGRFDYRSFPTGNLICYSVESCLEFNKIDTYTTVESLFMEEPHLVMTGTSSNPQLNVLVDITMPTSGPLYGQYYISASENEKLDDVATTENYVVVSSRNVENGIPVIYYLQFKIPHYLGQDIFSTSMERIRVSSPVANSIVLLEHSSGDEYASAYKNSGYPQIEVSFFSAPSTIVKGITILGDSLESFHPMDIKYRRGSKVYDILARNRYNALDYVMYHHMQIYHIDPNIFNNLTSYGNITRYPHEALWSIDPLHKTSHRFCASGFYSGILRFYRYNHYQWLGCTTQSKFFFRVGKPEGAYVGEWWVIVRPIEWNSYLKEKKIEVIPFPLKCGEE